MKRFLPALLLCPAICFGQQSYNFSVPKAATVLASAISTDWNPNLQSLEAPMPGGEGYRSYLQELRQNLPAPTGEAYHNLSHQRNAGSPLVLAGFDGNPYNQRVPNDNDMSVSNDGKIISVINSSLYVFDDTGTVLFSSSLAAFSTALGLPESKYDPRTIYDPLEDRFVVVFLNSFDDSTSYIVVAFSQTNDPTGAWNLYKLSGNPRANGTWTDFPMIALTEDEFIVTGNSILNDTSWQEGFVETLLWQVNKHDGYAGDSLAVEVWFDIQHGGKSIRNLRPVKGGTTLHGPDVFFISNRNFDVENDTFFLVHLTDSMNGSPQVDVTAIVADVSYGVPPVARQPNNHTFETNDGRMLSAFIENNRIHFAGNCRIPGTGFAGIYHGIVSDPYGTPSISGNILGEDSVDFGYPNIMYTGNNPVDECLIVFDHSGPDTFPGLSAVFYENGTYSQRTSIKTGDSYVNVLSGTYERWGDYTGAQRAYNEPGTFWVSGNFGKFVGSGFPRRQNATWIAKLSEGWPVGADQPVPRDKTVVFPNPFLENFTTRFSNPQSQRLAFTLLDMQGRQIQLLLSDYVKKGEHEFSFSTVPLTPGTYLLRVESQTGVLATAELVKQ